MQSTFTILTLPLIFYISNLYAQPDMGNSLLELEYKIYHAESDTLKNQLYLQKIQVYISHNTPSFRAFNEANRVKISLLNNAQKQDFLWNASLLSLLNDKPEYADHYFSQYMDRSNDKSRGCQLLGLLIYSKTDTSAMQNYITAISEKDSLFISVACLKDVMQYNRKQRGIYIVASAIVPGLGSMLNGNVFKGMSSLAVNSASLYVTHLLTTGNLYINAITWGLILIPKFYIGNLHLTNRLFEQKENRKRNQLHYSCKKVLEKLIVSYPLEFK